MTPKHEARLPLAFIPPGTEVLLAAIDDAVDPAQREQLTAYGLAVDRPLRVLQQRPMTSLSSGEARRFLIGRALVHDPRTLILDEPTNSLDLHSLHTFRSMLRKIARSGTGIILVTHNIHDIIPEIRRVILMKDGRFWKDGPKTRILTDENLTELFRVPLSVLKEGGYYYATGY